jgi:hypothetical protein
MSQTAVWLGLLYLVLIIALVWVLLRKRSRARTRRVPDASPATGPRQEADRMEDLKRCGLYWGVSLRARENSPCCQQAQALLGQHFTLDQAPHLPLQGCDLDCHCHYHPLLEQRDGKVRRVQHDRRNNLRYEPDKKNRRLLPTRRG